MSDIEYISEEQSFIFDSDTANGAKNVSSDGSRFQVVLENSLGIPKNARNVNLSVNSANIWYSTPNIITGVNDKLYIDGPDKFDVTQTYVITIPQGLYDLSSLNDAIQDQLQNAGAKYDDYPLIDLSANTAEQKVIITLNYIAVIVDFTQSDTFRDILGFNSQILTTISVPYNIIADNVARLNQIEYFLIQSDLTNNGIRINNRYSGNIARVVIDSPPGSLLVYEPRKPLEINCQNLANSNQSVFTFALTDQNGAAVDTNSELWSVQVTIRYKIPHSSSRS